MRPALAGLVSLLIAILVAVSALPLLDSDVWFVRMADFPRLQIMTALVVLVFASVFLLRRRAVFLAALLLPALAATGWHAATLWPYRSFAPPPAASCDPSRTVKVMVANVQLGNRTAAPLVAMVKHEKPDIFLAMETDEWWDGQLAELDETMPHTVSRITGGYYGMHLFSRLPLTGSKVRHLANQDTPAIDATVRLRDGTEVRFFGVHPRPPQPFHPSTGRDAQLYAAGLALRGEERPFLLGGDLNATPWETTTQRMRRIAGLSDPRRGNGYFATYNATSSWRRWPLDQIFDSPDFSVVDIERLSTFGSDHFPYRVTLCHDGTRGAVPALRPGDLEQARSTLEKARNAAGR